MEGSIPTPSGVSIPGELVARLEVASGPAIVFDAELFWLFDRQRATTAFWRGAMGLPKPLPDDFSRLPRGLGMASLESSAPNYTASLDAALALAERVLPTFTATLTVYRTNGGEFKPHALANLMCPYGEISEHHGDATTPALALCIAILKATPTRDEQSSASEGVG